MALTALDGASAQDLVEPTEAPAVADAPAAAPAPEGARDERRGEAPVQAREGKLVPAKVIRRPEDAEIRPLYPEKALAAAKGGRAVVVCDIGLDARLKNCVVKSEDPAGFGFGDALIRSTAFYRVRPPSYDGEPLTGGKIELPMTFQLELPSLEQQEADRVAAKGRSAELVEQRRARLAPLKRSESVLWTPIGFAMLVGAGLAWALSPLRRGSRPSRL